MAKFSWGREPEVDEQEKARQEAFQQMQQGLGMLAGQVKEIGRQVSALARQRGGGAEPPLAPELKPHEPKLDMTGLPDPVTDKDKFLTEVQKRLQTQMDTLTATMKAGVQQDSQRAQAAQQANAKVDALWKKWQKAHPEFAKLGKIVKAEAQDLIAEGAAQGLGPMEVMFENEDGFLEDLAERVAGAASEMGVAAKPAASPAQVAENVDAGLQQFEGQFKFERPGGGDAGDLAAGDIGSMTPKKSGPQADKPLPLVDQLKKAQEAMGIA